MRCCCCFLAMIDDKSWDALETLVEMRHGKEFKGDGRSLNDIGVELKLGYLFMADLEERETPQLIAWRIFRHIFDTVGIRAALKVKALDSDLLNNIYSEYLKVDK